MVYGGFRGASQDSDVGKYDPLRRRLSRLKTDEVVLSFAEIERIIGGMLPNGAARPQWWSDAGPTDQRHVQRAAWRDAGYDAYLLAGVDKVRFKRVLRGRGEAPSA